MCFKKNRDKVGDYGSLNTYRVLYDDQIENCIKFPAQLYLTDSLNTFVRMISNLG